MNLTFRPITEADLPQVLTWQYAPPYEVYDMGEGFGDGRTDAEALSSATSYFLNPIYHFYSMVDTATHEVTAVVSYGLDGQVPGGDYSADALDIGLAVRPDLTGQGLGDLFVGAAISLASHTFQPPQLRVTIADFNKRARRVWEKHGFQSVHSFASSTSDMPFTIFTRQL